MRTVARPLTRNQCLYEDQVPQPAQTYQFVGIFEMKIILESRRALTACVEQKRLLAPQRLSTVLLRIAVRLLSKMRCRQSRCRKSAFEVSKPESRA